MPINHSIRPDRWQDRLDDSTEGEVRKILSMDTHGIRPASLDEAFQDVAEILVWYRHRQRRSIEFPTASQERDSLYALVDQAKALQRTWSNLAHSTKCSIGAANYESFDEFSSKLADVVERARELLATHERVDEHDAASGELVTRRRSPNEYKGQPRVDARREALKKLSIAWLRHTELGRDSLAAEKLLRGAKVKIAAFVNALLQILPGRTADDSNERLLRDLYSEAMTEARKAESSRGK